MNSSNYWENRYKQNGNSGAGSYGILATFKSTVINNFIKEHDIKSIIDYGVGDGNQLKLFDFKHIQYTGLDVSKTIIDKCKVEFKDQENKQFFAIDNTHKLDHTSETVLSSDVIYHLIEEPIYKQYMENLFHMATKFIIIYSNDINKSYGSQSHVKCRKFTEYITTNHTNWKLIQYIEQPHKKISSANFYIYAKTQ